LFDDDEYIEDWDEMFYLIKMIPDIKKITLADYPACSWNLYEYIDGSGDAITDRPLADLC